MLKLQAIPETDEAPLPEETTPLADATERGLELMLAAQQAMFEEIVHTRDDAIEHAMVQARVSAELISKIAGAHSVKDVVNAWSECSQHQIDVLTQDSQRAMGHLRNLVECSFALAHAATRSGPGQPASGPS
ncbi:MAG: hypothetical protein J0G95_10245 [Rhizobiales bacterium]|nr:hypothetical protein [Hyphomicrobiales bacterium]